MEDRLENIEEKVARVEEKIDKVGDALVILARLEERIITLFKGMDRHIDDLKLLTVRVTNLEGASTRVGVWGDIGNKLLWIVVGAGVAFVASNFVGKP